MTMRFAVGAAGLLVLTACGGQTKPAAVESDTSTSSAASSSSATSTSSVASTPVETPASSETSSASTKSGDVAAGPADVPAMGEKPSKDFVIGKWGTNGDCALAIDLRPDGTSDGPFGNWAYSDGVISFPDEPEFKVSVTVIDANTMESTNATSDKASRMTRCP